MHLQYSVLLSLYYKEKPEYLRESLDSVFSQSCPSDDVVLVEDGKVNNVSEYMEAADLLLSASLSEGMPMAVLEASMAGLPVLLSDIPAHREVVELVYGNDSRLFEKNKEGALTEKMQSIDMFTTDRTAIQKKTARYFASQVMADGYMEIYKRVLRERK